MAPGRNREKRVGVAYTAARLKLILDARGAICKPEEELIVTSGIRASDASDALEETMEAEGLDEELAKFKIKSEALRARTEAHTATLHVPGASASGRATKPTRNHKRVVQCLPDGLLFAAGDEALATKHGAVRREGVAPPLACQSHLVCAIELDLRLAEE